MRALGRDLPYDVEISGARSDASGFYDAVYTRRTAPHGACVPGAAIPQPDASSVRIAPWGEYANNPVQGIVSSDLIPHLRAYLKEKLPEYMVPSVFITLESLPLTPNGKIDRRALPKPDGAQHGAERAYVAPRTPTEEAVAGVWKQVLGLRGFGVRDKFFDVGGDSLKLVRIFRLLGERYPDAPLTVVDLFKHSTVEALSLHLEAHVRPGSVELAVQGFELSAHARFFCTSATTPRTFKRMLTEDVAIIGISGIYPDCDDLQGFYGNLRAGLDSVRQVSARRRADLGLDPSAECQMIASLERVDEFDHAFFGLSLREAEHMDPHQRWLLQLSCAAVENAGYRLSQLKGVRVAVVFSASNNAYAELLAGPDPDPTAITGNLPAALAGRVSYALDLRGPALVIDTACSSSLVAIYEACKQLYLRETEYALAGGVNFFFGEDRFGSSSTGIVAPDGRSKAFDAAADGRGGARAEASSCSNS